MTNNNN